MKSVLIVSPDVYSYGAMLVGGVLRDRGYRVRIARGLHPSDVEKREIVGLSLVSVSHLLGARGFVEEVKRKEGVKVVVGGPITQAPELVFGILPRVDAVVMGEGEDTAPELVNAIESGEELETVEGIAFLEDGTVVRTSPRDPPELVGRPLPEIPSDIGHQDIRGANVYVETHRGCLGSCGFCQVPCLFGRHVRSRPVDEIVAEVKAFKAKGARRISLFGGTSSQYGSDSPPQEEMFVEMLRRVSEVVGARNLSVPDLRVDGNSDEILESLKRYTIGFVIFGIESGSNRMLVKMRKGITVQKIRDGVERAKEAGLEVAGAFIVGYPGESEEDYLQTRELVEELMLDDYTISIADPIVGTPLAQEVISLPEEEIPVFMKDEGKIGSIHGPVSYTHLTLPTKRIV